MQFSFLIPKYTITNYTRGEITGITRANVEGWFAPLESALQLLNMLPNKLKFHFFFSEELDVMLDLIDKKRTANVTLNWYYTGKQCDEKQIGNGKASESKIVKNNRKLVLHPKTMAL